MITKKKYNSIPFSYAASISGFNFGQIGNSFFPEIDNHVLILVGIIFGAIIMFNFIYQHIKARKTN
ncbi:MAG: hypothetical protein WAR79_03200 [Melioribacteraceae bacterium]